MHLLCRVKRYKIYSRKRLFWNYRLQQSFSYRSASRICFHLFSSSIKSFLSDFTRKWAWFHGYEVHFPKNLGLRLNFQKTEAWFCGWRSNDYNNINIFQSLETPYTLLLAKEKTWKRIFKPTANGLKTIQKNNSCHPKQQYIDCLMIYYAI